MANQKVLQQIRANFQETLSDKNFSRNEKNALTQVIAEIDLSQDDIRYLQNSIFDIARSQVNSTNYQQIIDWLETANKTIISAIDNVKEDAYFSPGDECVNAIIGCIEKAAFSIDICVFTITDNRITRKIKDAHTRGVKVRIITDNDKSLDRGSDIDEMHKHGIETKIDYTDDHMHHKFAVFDSKVLITGSYNWTRSAGNSNYENILISNNGDVITKYKSEFEDLWVNMMDVGYSPFK